MKRKYEFPVSIIILESLTILILVGLLIWQKNTARQQFMDEMGGLPHNLVSDGDIHILDRAKLEQSLLKKEEVPFSFLAEKDCPVEPFVGWHYQGGRYNSELVWWTELSQEGQIQEFEEKLSITVPNVDFEKYSILVSPGRRIEALRAFFPEDPETGPFAGNSLPYGIVTFSCDFYQDKVFFYTIERPEPGQPVFFDSSYLSYYLVVGEDFLGESSGFDARQEDLSFAR